MKMRCKITGDYGTGLIRHAKQLPRGCEITKNQLFLFQVQIAMTVGGLIIVLKRCFTVFFARLWLINKLYGGFHVKLKFYES